MCYKFASLFFNSLIDEIAKDALEVLLGMVFQKTNSEKSNDYEHKDHFGYLFEYSDHGQLALDNLERAIEL